MEWLENPSYLRNEGKGRRQFGVYYKVPGTSDDARGYFAFIKSVYDYQFKPEPRDGHETDEEGAQRCDANIPVETPKPTALHEMDETTGICLLCGSSDPIYPTTNSHVASLSNMRILRLPIQGYKGFVVYLQMDGQELEEKDFHYSENLGKTLQELFRLMLEWEWCYKELGCRDTYSVLCHEMLQELEMPDSIKDWLWNEVPEQRVAKFLKGDPNARERGDVSLIPDMTLEFDAWCWYHIVGKPAIWEHGER
jgi:hypothetical protein